MTVTHDEGPLKSRWTHTCSNIPRATIRHCPSAAVSNKQRDDTLYKNTRGVFFPITTTMVLVYMIIIRVSFFKPQHSRRNNVLLIILFAVRKTPLCE